MFLIGSTTYINTVIDESNFTESASLNGTPYTENKYGHHVI